MKMMIGTVLGLLVSFAFFALATTSTSPPTFPKPTLEHLGGKTYKISWTGSCTDAMAASPGGSDCELHINTSACDLSHQPLDVLEGTDLTGSGPWTVEFAEWKRKYYLSMHVGHANKHGTSWDGLGISGACITPDHHRRTIGTGSMR